ncbi:helix-turn-helix domain-containing protein [Leuconostoc pseudomesenteroides]|uniref:helix-turn-helix domain-containing protein n=1 Tax=Leuconostoc pseudomesenteroides TaxID=33968 RepID=UPI0039ED537C
MEKEQDIKYFTQIPAWVDELDNISDFQARLIGYIYTFENITGTVFTSNQRLAKRFHKSSKTVQTALSDLYNKGIVHSTLVYKEDSKLVDKRYLEVVKPTGIPTPENEGTLYPKTSIPYPQKRAYPIPENGVDNKSINKSVNRLVNNNVAFDEIWKLYPKKSGKTNAMKDFNKALKAGVSPELIKSKLEEYLKQIKIKGTPKQYIKNGSTWFHQKGWEDEYDFTPDVQRGYGNKKRIVEPQLASVSEPVEEPERELPEWLTDVAKDL